MSMGTGRMMLAALAALLIVPSAAAAQTATPSQSTRTDLVTLTAEVKSIDPATREIALLGPLGGTIEAVVSDQVKNLDQVKVGDLVEITYYQSLTVSAHKVGEPNPLFTGGDASTAAPGERPAAEVTRQEKETVTVVAVDPEKRMLVVQGEDGTLYPSEVARPEFAAKLGMLRPGDKLDVILTEAVVMEVRPAQPGVAPSAAYAAGTLIVDRGEVLQVVGNTILIRNEHGRSVRVVVDPSFKFEVNGKQITVHELKPGTKLTRTAFRVTDVRYVSTN